MLVEICDGGCRREERAGLIGPTGWTLVTSQDAYQANPAFPTGMRRWMFCPECFARVETALAPDPEAARVKGDGQ